MSSPKSPPDGGTGPERAASDGRVYDPDLGPSQPEIRVADRPDIQHLLTLLAEDPPLNDAPAAVPLAPQANGVLVTEGEEAASAYVPPTTLPAG
jgi:hypothetical protein